ncbi:hypothetical protein AKG98_2035 [Moritella sp. JT01]|uniref:hypothetical protein n=1 Tax=Moritella sp. JT01 TaxID=756698 RepID=UPI00079699EC|nr:hypothetical protein [Moritella sp. JT01]KXO07992.1 hypothetical protein AKG98_2035 [Moritella sp. JT01]
MYKILPLLTTFALTGFIPSGISGEFSGHVGLEATAFFEPAIYENQKDTYASLSTKINYYHDWDNGYQRFETSIFGRVDGDDERTHADIRELYYWRAFNRVELYAGVRQVFWGVTESAHLVDIINQTDLVESIDGEEKLGQAMINTFYETDYGAYELFVLPGFRERTFTGEEGRLRPSVIVDQDNATYESGKEQSHIDYAFRWSHVVDVVDIGLSYFNGTDRNPTLTPNFGGNGVIVLTPYYRQIQQYGLDLQATIESWAWKMETIAVIPDSDDNYFASVSGFEYTLVGLSGSSTDLGLIVEYQYDQRDADSASLQQNDIVVGTRWVLNNADSTEILLIGSVDLDDSSVIMSVEAQHRLTDNWSVSIEARYFGNASLGDPTYDLRQDSYARVEFNGYF